MKFYKYVLYISFILSFIYTLIIYPTLPSRVPIHWDVSGEVDKYADKPYVFLLLAIVVVIYYAFPYLKRVDPKRDNYEKFKGEYEIYRYAITLVFLGIYILSILTALDKINVERIIPIIIGVLMMVIGNYMSRIKQSFFVGIKTPWTLASEKSWNKTHRLGGYIFVLSGLLLIFSGIINIYYFNVLVFIFIMLGIIYTFYYSYRVYKEEKNG